MCKPVSIRLVAVCLLGMLPAAAAAHPGPLKNPNVFKSRSNGRSYPDRARNDINVRVKLPRDATVRHPFVERNLIRLERPTRRLLVSPNLIRSPRNFGGSIWAGSESLAGHSGLQFQFQPGGHVVRIGARGRAAGTWELVANQVRLRFDNGNCVYSGTINGTRISGVGYAGNRRFTWSVNLR